MDDEHFQSITPDRIQKALDGNGFEAVEELFFPGEAARQKRRRLKYPKPEGTGRPHWPEETKDFINDNIPGYEYGRMYKETLYFDGIYVGTIEQIRTGFMTSHFKTQDGEKFEHRGGENGAYWYLRERYWLYGDPPIKPSFRGLMKSLFSVLGGNKYDQKKLNDRRAD